MRDPNRLIQDVAAVGVFLAYLGWRWRCRKRVDQWFLEGKRVDRTMLDEAIEELNGECQNTFIVNRIMEVSYEGRTIRLVDGLVGRATVGRYSTAPIFFVVATASETDWYARQRYFTLFFQGARYALVRVNLSKVMKGVKGIQREV